jgi:hypothetical protein
MSDPQTQYEAPSVEEIETAGLPIDTSPGAAQSFG